MASSPACASRRWSTRASTRRAGRSSRPPARLVTIECDDVLMAIGQENAFPWIERDIGLEFDEWDMPDGRSQDVHVDAARRVLRRRRGVGTREHHLGGGARPPGRDLDRRLLQRASASTERPAPGAHAGQPEDGHPRVVLLATTTPRATAWPCRTPTQGVAASNLKLEVELGFDDQLAAKEVERCLNCDVQTVFTDNAVHRVRRLHGHLPGRLHQLHRERRRGRRCARELRVPALNMTQDIYVSGRCCKTGRIMAKDEDVCLHCGLCAERCPTGAWDMQKFIYVEAQASSACLKHHNAYLRMDPDAVEGLRQATGRGSTSENACNGPQRPNRTRMGSGPRIANEDVRDAMSGINDFVIKFATVNGSGSASRPTPWSPRRCSGWASRSARRTSFRRTSRACRPGTRCACRRRATWRAATAST